jgi:hypothetical protein
MKLKPTFKSEKTSRNCKWCMFFWSMLIIFWSIGSIADEEVIEDIADINYYILTDNVDLIKVKSNKDNIINYIID